MKTIIDGIVKIEYFPIPLREDEVKLIYLLRKARPFSEFRVEKRPTKKLPFGEITRSIEETSWLFHDLQVNFAEMLEKSEK